jgi:hypothetical protein
MLGGAVYLYQKALYYYYCSRARFFITSVVGSYLFYDPTIGFGLEVMTSNLIGLAITIIQLFFIVMRKREEIIE